MIVSILKVIGIVLLVLIGIILFLLFYLLLCPIRYRFGCTYIEKNLDVEAKVTWLPVLLKATVTFKDNQLEYIVKLLGGVILTNTDAKISFIGRKLFSESSSKKDEKQKEKKDSNKEITSTKEKSNEEDKTSTDSKELEETASEKKESIKEKKPFGQKIKEKIQTIVDKIKLLNKKRELLIKVYKSKRFEVAKKDIIKYVKQLWKIIRPRKLEGWLHLGLEDPATTGELFGVFALFLPWYEKSFRLQPEFEYAVVEGKVNGKGKITLMPVLILALKVLLNKNLIKVKERVQTIIERDHL